MTEVESTNWTGEQPDNRTRLRALIGQGAKIAGGAVGGALGFLAGGPAGAAAMGAAGVMASEALSQLGEDVSQRMLGPRERVRVGGVIALSADRIRKRLESGDPVRADGFLNARHDGRSDADEIAESIITKAQRESEEKKLPYMANMLANITFESWVTLPMAQQLAKAAEALTFRQICILRASVVIQGHPNLVRQGSYHGHPHFPSPLLDVLYETHDLVQRGLIAVEGVAVISLIDIDPSKLGPQGIGVHLYNLMELGGLAATDYTPVIEALR